MMFSEIDCKFRNAETILLCHQFSTLAADLYFQRDACRFPLIDLKVIILLMNCLKSTSSYHIMSKMILLISIKASQTNRKYKVSQP